MRVAVERRSARMTDGVQLLEAITPRTNVASLTAAENLLASVSLRESFALEIAATHEARRFLVRAASASMREHLAGQLGATYPQAAVRTIDPARDPARVAGDEQMLTCVLALRA